jgi:hypothetical protein
MSQKFNQKDNSSIVLSNKDSSYPISRISAKFEPVNQLEVYKEAEKFLSLVEKAKLTVIVDQIKNLQKEARKIIMESQKNFDLHRASCQFIKRPGHTYYLYDRGQNDTYFSLISPQEWGENCPHKYVGSYRLEDDYSWSSVDEETTLE